MKLAIVVGHNSVSQGAVRSDTGVTEFVWNSDLAMMIEDEAEFMPDLQVQTFYRQPGGGYQREIERVYDEVDAWGADVSIELHFNSFGDPSARGTETLSSGTPMSMRLAVEVQAAMVGALGLRDRGVVTRRTGRGAESLISGRAPAILIEPFFASNDKNNAATDEVHEKHRLARAILIGARKAYGMMPRRDLAESRTIKEAERQVAVAQAGVVGQAAGGLGVVAIVQDAVDLGETLEGALPWLAGAGLLVALSALVVVPWLSRKIKDYRAQDHARELR